MWYLLVLVTYERDKFAKWVLHSTAKVVLVLRMCLQPRNLEHYVVLWVWISWYTRTTVCARNTSSPRTYNVCSWPLACCCTEIASHTGSTFQLPLLRNSVSRFIRERRMDDKVSWLGEWPSQWRPPQLQPSVVYNNSVQNFNEFRFQKNWYCKVLKATLVYYYSCPYQGTRVSYYRFHTFDTLEDQSERKQ